MARLEELIVWQVAVAFSDAVMDLDAAKGRRLPRRLREQQFVLFIDYARGSLGEAEARLRIAVIRRAFSQEDIEPILRPARRFAVASWRLRCHLRNQTDS